LAGTAYGDINSGFAVDNTGTLGAGAFVVTNGAANRFPATASTNPVPATGLSAAEVTQIINSAIGVANQARAQIRRPLNSPAQVTVSVVDLDGTVLGMARTPDAPIFGADVSLQKARTAAFFSSANAGTTINGRPNVTYLLAGPTITLSSYVSASTAFGSTAFTGSVGNTGDIAFSARAIGNIARPLFPDGINGTGNGPLSKSTIAPNNFWSPFNTGLQLDLVYNALTFAILNPTDGNDDCSASPATATPGVGRIQNGIQIFPGAVPIYRGSTLIGAIGVSGDGVDQDDMTAFLGLERASTALGGSFGNAPPSI
ncbi:MAG: heme-binding protein, partial [Pseudomonadota bacterium]